jgi:hypothetical protein
MRRAVCLAASVLCAAASSCGSTAGALVTLPFRAGGQQAGGPLTFTTPNGWTVTLQTAKIALGPFYFNTQPPSTEEFRNGLVLIQVTRQVIVDALDPSLHDVPGGADGQTEHAVAVEIGLLAPDTTQPSALRAQLAGNVGLVAGTASKGSTTVPFSGPIAIDASQATTQHPLADLQRVRGAAVDLDFTAVPQALELRVDPTHWFDQVDFTELLQGTPSNGVFTWGLHSTFLNQLVQGVKQETGVYQFQLVPR